MTKLSIHPHKELKTHWYDKLNRFTVKSPESHLARNLSHVARNFRDVAQKKKVKSLEETNTKRSEFQTVNRQ